MLETGSHGDRTHAAPHSPLKECKDHAGASKGREWCAVRHRAVPPSVPALCGGSAVHPLHPPYPTGSHSVSGGRCRASHRAHSKHVGRPAGARGAHVTRPGPGPGGLGARRKPPTATACSMRSPVTTCLPSAQTPTELREFGDGYTPLPFQITRAARWPETSRPRQRITSLPSPGPGARGC